MTGLALWFLTCLTAGLEVTRQQVLHRRMLVDWAVAEVVSRAQDEWREGR